MDIQSLVLRFRRSRKWIFSEPSGLPQLSHDPRAPNVSIPEEVLRFYELCGGLETDPDWDSDVAYAIVPPNDFKWAIARIVGRYPEQFDALRNNRAWYWYVIGAWSTEEYFVIDLASERYGRCYYTTFYTFAQPGRTPIVATSFQDLLKRIYEAAARHRPYYWRHARLGDAYD